jgi:hypothetical protein
MTYAWILKEWLAARAKLTTPDAGPFLITIADKSVGNPLSEKQDAASFGHGRKVREL